MIIFILLGLGIDDAFVVVQTNLMVKDRGSIDLEEELARTLYVAGGAITVTSLTDACAFLSGMGNSLPVIRHLCGFGALGILFIYALQLTVLVGVLAFNRRREKRGYMDCCCFCHSCDCSRTKEDEKCCSSEPYDPTTVTWLQSFFETTFPNIILSKPGKVVVLAITITLAAVMGWGAPKVEAMYESKWFLPSDSTLVVLNDMYGALFPTEICTRECHWFPHLIASSVCPMAFLSGVHFLADSHCKLRPNTLKDRCAFRWQDFRRRNLWRSWRLFYGCCTESDAVVLGRV
jgi:predicted RND superfamily exporter protein